MLDQIMDLLRGREGRLSAAGDAELRAAVAALLVAAACMDDRFDSAERIVIERLLAERCIALIGFARRADQIFVGRDQVKAAISAGQVALLLAAADSEGRDATDLAARFGGERFSVLTSAELGAALGREGIVHMGVKPGRLAETLARELRRLHGFRAAEATAAPTARGRRH